MLRAANRQNRRSIQLWRSVRARCETKTKRSRRTLELPALCVDALREHGQRQLAQRMRIEEQWVRNDLVFATRYGPSSTRRMCAVRSEQWPLPPAWKPRSGRPQLRHSFVSLLSSSGVPIEDIAHLVAMQART